MYMFAKKKLIKDHHQYNIYLFTSKMKQQHGTWHRNHYDKKNLFRHNYFTVVKHLWAFSSQFYIHFVVHL